MIQAVKRTIETYAMLAAGEDVLVALSGGADSVALLCALRELGYPVRAFHLNHGLRGAEAERDEAFCRDLCARLGVPLVTERADVRTAAAERGESIETGARHVRYDCLHRVSQGAKIATAHTADDNVETVLFHLARGTGSEGLAGIPPVRGRVVRPLIEVSRAQVEAYLRGLEQAYVTDSTNADERYTRNRLRHTVVPALREVNPVLTAAVGRLSGILRQENDFLAHETERLLDSAQEPDGAWRIRPLCGAHPALRARALRQMAVRSGMPMRDFTAAHVAALEQLLENPVPSAAFHLPHGFTARREYDKVYIAVERAAAERAPVALTVPFDGTVWQGALRVSIRRIEKNISFYKSFNTFCVDCGTICFDTLCIRTRMAGDRLRLTENGGSRTLKKLMIDRKIPREKRDALAVFADRNGVIAVQGIGSDISRAPRGGALIEIKIEE